MEEFQATLDSVLFSNDEMPFCVLRMGTKTACGNALSSECILGQRYTLIGKWTEHPKYGKQFKFNSMAMRTPLDEQSVTAYLEQAPGLGPVKADQLWARYGESAIDKAKDTVVLSLHGLSGKRAEMCRDWLLEREATQQTRVELVGLLDGRGFPKSLINELIKDCGAEAPGKVRDNCFFLLNYSGVGFRRVDPLWIDLGKELHDPIRAKHLAAHCVRAANDGSTWYHRQRIIGEIRGTLGTDRITPDECLDLAVGDGLLVVKEDGEGIWYAEAIKSSHEFKLAKKIVALHTSCNDTWNFVDPDKLQWPDVGSLSGLTDHQKEQLGIATSGPLGILTGGPGVGKTFTMTALIRALVARGSNPILTAPTGKAAVRVNDMLANAGIPANSRTMHSTLGWQPLKGFVHGEKDKFKSYFHILDEQSMVDTSLMWHYLSAVKQGGHVLLVLDPYQLPPVSSGCPALDLIRNKIPCGVLREPMRNSGRIVQTCLDIREGRELTPSRELDVAAGENLVFTGSRSTRESLDDLDEQIDALMEDIDLDIATDVQVIAPLNKKGELSVEALNKRLQRKCNGRSPAWDGWDMRVGDKIICTLNGNYWHEDGIRIQNIPARTYVANGEQGIVEEIRDTHLIARMSCPRRLVRFYRNDPIQLSWAITCHKSQGSEWPITIVVFDPAANFGLGVAEWVTTGISRAKRFCICVGTVGTARRWVKKTSLFNRKTFLRESMRDARLAGRTQ